MKEWRECYRACDPVDPLRARLSRSRTAGGSNRDSARSVTRTTDGGYIVAGMTESYGAGGEDVFLLKYAANGTLSWARTAGWGNNETAHSIDQTEDDGYIVVGRTDSYSAGGEDALLLKYAVDGTLSWAKTAGGSENETSISVAQTVDGGYVLAGSTASYGAGNSDVLLMKSNIYGEIYGCLACVPGMPATASVNPLVFSPIFTTNSYSFSTSSPDPEIDSPSPENILVCDGIERFLFMPMVLK